MLPTDSTSSEPSRKRNGLGFETFSNVSYKSAHFFTLGCLLTFVFVYLILNIPSLNWRLIMRANTFTHKICQLCKAPLPIPRHGLRKYCSGVCKQRGGETFRKEETIRRRSKLAWANMTEEKKKSERERHRKYGAYLRRVAISHYGGSCACCGENKIEFLAIDHINGGGNKHRKSITGRGSLNISQWLKKHNYPDGFRILCHNCNMAIGFYGKCPHNSGADSVHITP